LLPYNDIRRALSALGKRQRIIAKQRDMLRKDFETIERLLECLDEADGLITSAVRDIEDAIEKISETV
jgi:hypothetical protein